MKNSKLKTGLGLLIMGLFVLVIQHVIPSFGYLGDGIAMVATVPALVVEMDVDDLDESTAKVFKSIKKRMRVLAPNTDKEAIAAEIRAAVGGLGALKDMKPEELSELLGDSDKGLRSIMIAQGLRIKELETKGTKNVEDLSVRGQVVSWVEQNKEAIEQVKSGKRGVVFTTLEVRVASPMTPANTLNGSAFLPQPQFEAGYNDIVRVQPTFWDYLKKGRSSSATYVWTNKKNPLGAAGFIGPGVAKPGISFELETQTSKAVKIADSIKVATELLEDIDGITTMINDELRYQVMQKANTTLLQTGVASATVPASIKSLSVPYSLTTVATTNANNWDAIRACVAQLRSGNLVGTVIAFVNPSDKANMDLTKAVSQGQYINSPPPTGAIIVEDNNMPVGYVQIAIIEYYRILMYKDFMVSIGWENTDFTQNLVTMLGEMRFHQFFSQNFTGAFIYDSFANIKTAITA